MEKHTSVMPQEVIANLNTKKEDWVIDCNLGQGGHSLRIIEELNSNVISIDLDKKNIDFVKNAHEFSEYIGKKLFLENDNFKNIKSIVAKYNLDQVDAIFYDLGLTQNQYKESDSGFGFESESLDMRLDKTLNVTAKDLILALGYKELAVIFEKFGGEKDARRLAKIIKEYVKVDQDITAKKLSDLISKHAKYSGKYNPSTRIFQSLRIAVNNEIESLQLSLNDSLEVLKSKGRLLIITFHKLEEQTVNDFIDENQSKLELVEVLKPTIEEKYSNQSSRSSLLFILEKQPQ